MRKEYKPEPIDTSDVELSPEITELCEKLAENTHEVWAKGRIAEGWTYGSTRDDAKKETPCLVPYDELPESEKDYDRNTAMETLKVIVKLGNKIIPPAKESEEQTVFISYKSEEVKKAKHLKEYLEKQGYKCWLAPDSIPEGSTYAREIIDAIIKCSYFVTLISPKSVKSCWCLSELDRAVTYKKPIFPYYLESTDDLESFEIYICTIQSIDGYSCDPANAYNRLLSGMKTSDNWHSDKEGESVIDNAIKGFEASDVFGPSLKQESILRILFAERKIYIEKVFDELEKRIGDKEQAESFIKGFKLSDTKREEFEQNPRGLILEGSFFDGVSSYNDLIRIFEGSDNPEIKDAREALKNDYDRLVECWFNIPYDERYAGQYDSKLRALKETEKDNRIYFANRMNSLLKSNDVSERIKKDDELRAGLFVMSDLIFVRFCMSGTISTVSEKPRTVLGMIKYQVRKRNGNSDGLFREESDPVWLYTLSNNLGDTMKKWVTGETGDLFPILGIKRDGNY